MLFHLLCVSCMALRQGGAVESVSSQLDQDWFASSTYLPTYLPRLGHKQVEPEGRYERLTQKKRKRSVNHILEKQKALDDGARLLKLRAEIGPEIVENNAGLGQITLCPR
ncbi:hypothetical protein B0T21DRAFT_361304 [Apiosordaria backusii]|uniref:Uncharacterized protein n=1 Tax=Apiosordaria backusii TaxID=314023 RepID=A0AA40EN59_9PEZI|nr:hypothetical protein B0T21DRAFT_361304 [Apiosordaria backusii]